MKPFTVLALCIYLFACSNPKENAIAEFVETSGNVRTDMVIRVHELKQAGWITGKDSLELIQEGISAQKKILWDIIETKNEHYLTLFHLASLREMNGSEDAKSAKSDAEKLRAEVDTIYKKIEVGYKGINPQLDSLLSLEKTYSANPDANLLPIYHCKYSFTNQGQKSTATVKFVFSKDESKVLAQL